MDEFMAMLELFNMLGAETYETAVQQNPNPFTPDGQATVMDWATEYDGKEFYTFKTPAGNVFFLVIDHARANDNVYFLNAVTETDLLTLAEQAGEPIDVGAIPPSVTNPTHDIGRNEPGEAEPAGDSAEKPTEENGGGNTGMIVFVVIAVLAIGGVGYYIKIVRPKQQAGIAEDDEDEPEDDEDIPFADEAEEDPESYGDDNYAYTDDEDIEESDNGKEGEDE